MEGSSLAGNDDPKEIADYLIQEHGIEKAIEIAKDGVAKANASTDYYSLSIWREVRSLLIRQE